MSIYVGAVREFVQPLGVCNRIVPGTFFWRGLKMVHRMWWLKTRKERLFDQSDIGDISVKAIIQPALLQLSFIKTPAQLLMIAVKIEDVFEAYHTSQTAYRTISQTWRGDFSLARPTLFQKIKQTSDKVYHYMVTYFCLIMTFIDALEAVLFSKKSICEATFQIPENFSRVKNFFAQKPEDLQTKLHHHSKLIEVILSKKKDHKGADVEAFIQEVVDFHQQCRKIQEISRLLAQPFKSVFNGICSIKGQQTKEEELKNNPFRYCEIE